MRGNNEHKLGKEGPSPAPLPLNSQDVKEFTEFILLDYLTLICEQRGCFLGLKCP